MITYPQRAALNRQRDAGAAERHLLGDEARIENTESQAAHLGRNVAVHQAQRVGLLNNVPRIFAGFVVMLGTRDNLVARELARQLLDFALLVGQSHAKAAGRGGCWRRPHGTGAERPSTDGGEELCVCKHIDMLGPRSSNDVQQVLPCKCLTSFRSGWLAGSSKEIIRFRNHRKHVNSANYLDQFRRKSNIFYTVLRDSATISKSKSKPNAIQLKQTLAGILRLRVSRCLATLRMTAVLRSAVLTCTGTRLVYQTHAKIFLNFSLSFN